MREMLIRLKGLRDRRRRLLRARKRACRSGVEKRIDKIDTKLHRVQSLIGELLENIQHEIAQATWR